MKFRIWITALVLVIGLSGCGDPPTIQTTAVPESNATRQPSNGKAPVFSFMPKQGQAGMILHAAGANFQPETTVFLRLGVPDPVGDPLTSTKTDAEGKWNTTITVPGTLPSGQAIS